MTLSKLEYEDITVADAKEATINRYFSTINRESFLETATLFSETGELLAPFEKPIKGREAISSYLDREAKGMILLPKKVIAKNTERETRKIEVIGKVKTTLFTVNVAWFFSLNNKSEITAIRIKLLASPQELLNLRKFQD